MNIYRDDTANIAIGHTHKEWKKMAELALRIRADRCNPVWAEEQEAKFTGIYKRLLTDPIEELHSIIGR